MASGDVTITVAVEGGVSKASTVNSATRVLALAYETARDSGIDTDAEWQVLVANEFAQTIVSRANRRQQDQLSYTPKPYTAAS